MQTPPPKNGWPFVYVYELKLITPNTPLSTCLANPGLMYREDYAYNNTEDAISIHVQLDKPNTMESVLKL